MPKFTGLTADTGKHLQLDAGCLLKNFDITKTFETQKANIIGATAGGGSFAAAPTIRNIDLDGKKGDVAGFDVLDGWTAALTANVKELTAENLKMFLGAADISAPKSPEGYTQISPRNEIQVEDYVKNVAWVGRLSGSQKPLIIVLDNAISTNGLSLTFADKSEATPTMTLTARYDPANLEKVPFAIYYPNVDGTPAKA